MSMRFKSPAFAQTTTARRASVRLCAAKKGFGDTSKKAVDTRTTYIKKEVPQRLAKELGLQVDGCMGTSVSATRGHAHRWTDPNQLYVQTCLPGCL